MMRGKIPGAVLGALVFASCFSLSPAAEVRLRWNAPTGSNGSSLNDLAGFRVYFGRESGIYTDSLDVGLSQTATIRNLDPHETYFITVKAYSEAGAESDASEELSWSYDSNANGLPDAWEERYFNSIPDEGTGLDDDIDGDGVSNGDEYVMGSDPTATSDLPSVGIRIENGTPLLTFETLKASGPGYFGRTRTYTAEQCSDLTVGLWKPIKTCNRRPATGRPMDVPVGTAARALFFRVRIRLE